MFKAAIQLRDAAVQVVDVLVAPGQAIGNIGRDETHRTVIFAVLAPLFILIQMANNHIVSGNLLAYLDEAQRARVASTMQWSTLLTLVVAPVTLLAKAWIAAYLIWATSLFVGSNAPFPRVFALVMTAEIVLLLGQCIALIVWSYRGVGGLFAVPPVGLNLFVHAGPVGALAALLNPFSIWFCVLVVYGMARLGKIGYRAATISVVPYALGVVGLALANGSATRSLGLH